MEYMLSVTLFAISSSITPGPNNLMVMTSGVNFGIKKSFPLLTGICFGFTVMLLLVGQGFGYLFSQLPGLTLSIKIFGTVYLLYLAWLIFNSGKVGTANSQPKPFSFLKGSLFQWVNTKAWVVAIGALSAYTNPGDQFFVQNMIIAATFLVVSLPCVGIWLMFGSLLQKRLKNQRSLRKFNAMMAILLVLSVLPVLADICRQLIT